MIIRYTGKLLISPACVDSQAPGIDRSRAYGVRVGERTLGSGARVLWLTMHSEDIVGFEGGLSVQEILRGHEMDRDSFPRKAVHTGIRIAAANELLNGPSATLTFHEGRDGTQTVHVIYVNKGLDLRMQTSGAASYMRRKCGFQR